MTEMESKLSFFLTDKPLAFSVSHLDSDFLDNMVIMEQVVGTLVKDGSSGVGPYLAEKWISSADEKLWTFYLRKNLKCENGEIIDAFSFARNLKRLLRIYAKDYAPPVFDHLKGWKDFISGNDAALGIKAVGAEELVFKFEKRPSGFLEFLSMPYYGYYSDDDFDPSLKWKDNQKIISSGAYKLKDFTNFKVSLEARSGWFSLNESSPNFALVQFGSVAEAMEKTDDGEKKHVLISVRDGKNYHAKEFVNFNSAPTLVTSIVLSPFLEPFDNVEIRKSFRAVVRTLAKNEMGMISDELQRSNYFYQVLSRYPLNDLSYDVALANLKKIGPISLSVFINKLPADSDLDFVRKILSNMETLIGWAFEIYTPESVGEDWVKKSLSNKEFSLRVARVDAGVAPENWVVNMMFCSSMGISFPDPENRMCKNVLAYDKGEIVSKEDYWIKVHQAIEDSSSVVPLLRSGFSWLISTHIITENISPTMNIPRFDQLKLK